MPTLLNDSVARERRNGANPCLCSVRREPQRDRASPGTDNNTTKQQAAQNQQLLRRRKSADGSIHRAGPENKDRYYQW